MPCPVGALRRSCQPPCVARSWRQRDLGCSAPWRRTPHPLARSAKAYPFQSLLSARRPWSRGARTRDSPFEGLSYLGCSAPWRRTPHTSRAARKPILPTAYSARGGHGPAELAPETHHSKACPTVLYGVPSERIGFVCIIPRVSPWAGMPCPVGALRTHAQPPCVANWAAAGPWP